MIGERQPSRTALGAAAYRAAHQIVDGGAIFADPFAHGILGAEGDPFLAVFTTDPAQKPMMMFMAARSRFGEDSLAAAVDRGTRQVVVLGAGLDTFCLRNPQAKNGLHVFELDHPATQAWKRRRLDETGCAAPASTTFVPVDFESQRLGVRLEDAGFRSNEPAFFLWLGVVPYLREAAISATLRYIAGIPDAEVVFDYSEPLENYPPERRARVAELGRRTAEVGEPLLSHFNPADIARELETLGFAEIEDLDLNAIAVRYLDRVPSETQVAGPHVIRARTGGNL